MINPVNPNSYADIKRGIEDIDREIERAEIKEPWLEEILLAMVDVLHAINDRKMDDRL
jgi:hypothetical protein